MEGKRKKGEFFLPDFLILKEVKGQGGKGFICISSPKFFLKVIIFFYL